MISVTKVNGEIITLEDWVYKAWVQDKNYPPAFPLDPMLAEILNKAVRIKHDGVKLYYDAPLPAKEQTKYKAPLMERYWINAPITLLDDPYHGWEVLGPKYLNSSDIVTVYPRSGPCVSVCVFATSLSKGWPTTTRRSDYA